MPTFTLMLVYEKVADPNTRGQHIYSLKSPTGIPIHPDCRHFGSSYCEPMDEMPPPLACQLAKDIIDINRSSFATHGFSGRYAVIIFLSSTISAGLNGQDS